MTSETQTKSKQRKPAGNGIITRILGFAILIYTLHQIYDHHLNTDQVDKSLSSLPFFDSLPRHLKYTEETVETSDGYILRLFVVHDPSKYNPSLPPALLQHGYGSSGVNFLLNGDQSVAFILANLGYKSYIVNGRGTPLSLRHTVLQPSQPAFWEYSFEDLPKDSLAVLEHIRAAEGKAAVYIGHSQGAAQFLAGASSPESKQQFERLVAKAVLFAPVWCMKQATSYPVVIARKFGDFLAYFSKLFGVHHLGKLKYPEGCFADLKELVVNKVCGIHHKLCFLAMLETDSSNEYNSMDRYGTWIRYHITSSSVKGGLHFGQVSRDAQSEQCVVRHFDYGEDTNLKVYYTKKPPTFDISAIKIPTTMYYGSEDRFYGPEDEESMRQIMKNNKNIVIKHSGDWGHQSFVYGPDLSELFQEIHQYVIGK